MFHVYAATLPSVHAFVTLHHIVIEQQISPAFVDCHCCVTDEAKGIFTFSGNEFEVC